MDNIAGKDRLTVKEKMLAVFDALSATAAEDLISLDAKDRLRLMLDLGKVLMPKTDVDPIEEKADKKANKAALKEFFGQKVEVKLNKEIALC